MRSCRSLALFCCLLAAGCALEGAGELSAEEPLEADPAVSEVESELIPPPNFYSYSASNTNSAQQNTVNHPIVLNAGWEVTLDMCGSPLTGDTYVRLFGPGGVEVASNDNACGLGSKVVYRVTTSGQYEIRGGCAGATACSGTITWIIVSVDGSFPFSATNTNSARQNTVDAYVFVQTGRKLTVGTCGLPGASAVGDTYLRIFDPYGVQVGGNDDACGSLASKATYTSTSYVSYRIRAGCYGSGSCSGNVVWTIQ